MPVDLLVSGTVPPGSGLSSSSALVVASTLAFLAVNNKLEDVTKRTLVEMAMENEKRVGVFGGGYEIRFSPSLFVIPKEVYTAWTKLPP